MLGKFLLFSFFYLNVNIFVMYVERQGAFLDTLVVKYIFFTFNL